jgi:hypothetical protein
VTGSVRSEGCYGSAQPATADQAVTDREGISDRELSPLGGSDSVYSSSLTKLTSAAAPLAAHSVTSEMSTHALQTCEPNMSTIAAASR